MGFRVVFLELFLIFSIGGEYSLHVDRLHVDRFDPELVKVSGKFYYVKRNEKALDMNITFLSEELFNGPVPVVANCFKWSINQFKSTVIQFTSDFSEMQNKPFLRAFMKTSKPEIKTPPLVNVTYHFKGWIPKTESIPPNIPSGIYKLVQDYFHKEKSFMTISWFFSIEA